jgi:S-adenosylmethionine hydrolase
MNSPIITLLTDFGLSDHYVAAMKGVMLGICPRARLFDISHEITPYAIPEAAYTLAQAWRYFPRGTIHVAVVDPGVGSARRAIVAEVGGHRFVAPDNGLLSMILASRPRAKLREITATRYFRHPVSSTFHGRDVFAPVAAHLSFGLATSKLGKLIHNPILGDFAAPTQLTESRFIGAVLKVDRFGNVVTNFDFASFSRIATARFRLKAGPRTITRFHSTYADAPNGEIFALKGSSGYVEISINQSSAASRTGLSAGAKIDLILPVPNS